MWRRVRRDIQPKAYQIRWLHVWSKSKLFLHFNHSLPFSCDIEFKDVFVPEANRFAKADDFEKGLNSVLMVSRLTITWIFVGCMAGAFEHAYSYAMKRVQFGKPIAGF